MLKRYSLSFKEKIEEGGDIYTFTFLKPRGMTWRPGQHFIFSHGPFFDSRSPFRIFTASSAPSEAHFSFSTRYFGDQSSVFKKWLFCIKEGQKLSAWGPSPIQDYFVVDDLSKEYFFIIGGVGITPLISVLKDFGLTNKSIKGSLIFANGTSIFPFKSLIDESAQKMNAFDVSYVAAPERVSKDLIEKKRSKMKDPLFIISGPVGFIKAMNTHLHSLGVENSAIRGYKLKPTIGGGYKD